MHEAWDVIPDIHADAARLEASLGAVEEGARVAFLGDLIDGGVTGGPHDDLAVLERVRALVDAGRAVAILGNHELNAVLYHRTGRDGVALRSRSEDRDKQHRTFLDRFGYRTGAALSWCDWFLTLPLWADLGGLRLIHAAWRESDVATIAARRPDGRLRAEDLAEIAAKKSDFAVAVNRVVTGPEQKLPDGASFHDWHGKKRRHVRLAWWREGARTWREAALSVPDPAQLPDAPVPDFEPYHGAVPALVGHYKMTGPPVIETPRVASIDYPGRPCLYRWRGEARLAPGHLAEV